jgi:5-methylcytosine-specific restriction endonuclease McrA
VYDGVVQSPVLVLDAAWNPLGVIAWQQAIGMVLDRRARIVAEYADRVIRSATLEFPWPAVVALQHHVGRRRRMRFNRHNVLARDAWACAYCGLQPQRHDGRPDLSELTLDHVVPRAQSRKGEVVLPWSGRRVPVTCWENVVACCVPCNARKADRTPDQAGMVLRQLPRAPTPLDAFRMSLARVEVPDEWKDWVPAEWRGYWTVELEHE